MTAADFRRIALSFEGAEEGSHMGAPDFRVGGRIFATLASEKQGYGNLMLTLEQQADFVAEQPDVFLPIPGGWGRMGCTHIRLAAANEDMLAGALRTAWRLRIEKNGAGRGEANCGQARWGSPENKLTQIGRFPDRVMTALEALMRTAAAIALSLLLGASTAGAQFMDKLTKPKVPVQLRHPPGLGLNVKRIAFGQYSGECADQIVDMLTESLISSGIDVIDRQHLQSILDEHKFQMSLYLDSSTALQLGRILGPTALIFVKTQRCTTEQQPLREVQRLDDGSNRTIFTSRTRAFVRGSVQTVDLTTGRVFSAQTLQAAPVRDNRSDRGQPEFPSGVQLIDESLHVVAQQAVRMYVPWTETKEVYFYNDGDCKLKQAYELLKAGSFDSALEQSQANVTSCREQPKVKQSTLAHALYNAGVMQMMARNFDQAKKYLNEAADLKGGDIVTETIAECEKAEQLDRAMRQVEERTVAQEKARPAPLDDPRPAPVAKPSLEDRLRSLNDFYKKGLITKEDFDKRKAELLKEI